MLSKITSWRHSKIIAFVLAVAVFLTAFYAISPVISFADGESTQGENYVDYWDGIAEDETFDTVFGEQLNDSSAGTDSNPLEISTGDQLYFAVVSAKSYYYEIVNDICLQDVDVIDKFEEYVEKMVNGDNAAVQPEGLLSWHTSVLYNAGSSADGSVFRGHINGNFHTISGLYAPATKANTVSGLVPHVRGTSSIKNLTVDGAYVTAKYSAGGIVGILRAATSGSGQISGCRSINSYIANTNTTNAYAGGITGYLYSGKTLGITNCSAYGNNVVSSSSHDGGLVGILQAKSTCKNCFTDDVIYGTAYNGAHIIYENVCTTNSKSGPAWGTNVEQEPIFINPAQAKGSAMPGIRPATGWVIEAGEYPVYTGEENMPEGDTPSYWNGSKIDEYTSINEDENGTLEKPYSIYHGFELYAALQDEAGNHYVLRNDIYLNAPGVENIDANSWHLWVEKNEESSAKIFNGTLDGAGHTIYGYRDLTNADSDKFPNNFSEADCPNGVGLIPTASNATITNLHLRDVRINSWSISGAGALISTATGIVEISGCSVTNANIAGRRVASAFVGTLKDSASADISESVFQGTLTKRLHESDTDIEEGIVGGFVGNAGTANITLADVIANKYKLVGDGGTLAATRAYAIGNNIEKETDVNNSFSTYNGLKYKLRTNDVELSTDFYWDNINKDTSPLLKNRIATKDKDIDGDGDTELDNNDVLALSNIVLFATEDKPAINYVTLSDGNVNGYNNLPGVDITDIVSVYNAVKNTNN